MRESLTLELKRIIEALLFVSESPLSKVQLSQVLETKAPDEIQSALEELMADYEQGHAFTLIEAAGGYCFRTRGEYAFWLRKLKKDQASRLSRAALETLAIIAYKQPIMKAEVEKVRGVDVSGMLRMLMEKHLIRAVGRQDLPGRPLIYGTTKRFLEIFDLQDLRDLPTLDELKALAIGEDDEISPYLEGEEIEVLEALPSGLDQSSAQLLLRPAARGETYDLIDEVIDEAIEEELLAEKNRLEAEVLPEGGEDDDPPPA
jgi:segregation and condensation protein B